MSRIGKRPVSVPSGVQVSVNGDTISVQGPKGKLSYTSKGGVNVKVEANQVTVSLVGNDRQSKANFGSTRAHIKNMILGVSEGWKKGLELVGVGFTAKLNGKKLVLNTGYSHEVVIDVPADVTCKAEKTKF